MTAAEAEGIRRELGGIGERLDRIEARLDGALEDRADCELRCATKREPMYNRIGALEVGMGKIGLQAAALVGIAAFVGSTLAAILVGYVAKALLGP